MRRPLPRSTVAGAVGVACIVLVLATGCGGDDSEDTAKQEEVRARLVSRLESLPDAEVDVRIESSLSGGQNNVGVDVALPADATAAQLDAVGEKVERTIWLSRLDPLGLININFTHEGSAARVEQRLYGGTDKRQLADKYGPRPDGLPAVG